VLHPQTEPEPQHGGKRCDAWSNRRQGKQASRTRNIATGRPYPPPKILSGTKHHARDVYPAWAAILAVVQTGRFSMKAIAFGFAMLLAGTAASQAADAWKEAEVNGTKIYTDANGMTLYTYDKDEAGKSNCYDKCATNWPPLKAEADAKDEGEWTVVKRTDGTAMWAYEGHPLYTFIKDKKAGDTTGDGVGDVWHIAKAD
jgi:predicted lipoprotein with Yx(FWY)xxD motif